MARVHPSGGIPRSSRWAGYGGPKKGKTRWAAAAMRGAPEVFGKKALYVASDPDTVDLAANGMLREDWENLIVVEPLPETSEPLVIGQKYTNNEGKVRVYSPRKEATLVACRNWRAEFPDVDTLIWDTITEDAEKILQECALDESAPADSREGRVTYGKKGDPDYHVSPSRSDYGVAQNYTMKLLRDLIRSGLNLICLFHEDYDEKNNIGGPATIGRAAVGKISGKFQHTIRMDTKKVKTVDGKTKLTFVARCTPHAQWVAGVRLPTENYMPDQNLEADPVGFWKTYAELRNA